MGRAVPGYAAIGQIISTGCRFVSVFWRELLWLRSGSRFDAGEISAAIADESLGGW
jgi:hypothetical protein